MRSRYRHFHDTSPYFVTCTTVNWIPIFISRPMFDIAIDRNNTWLLEQLKEGKKHFKADRTYQLWQEGFHPQRIQSEEMMRQKINYIHNNPVRRGYVDDAINWVYSSARNYLKDDHSVLEIDLLAL